MMHLHLNKEFSILSIFLFLGSFLGSLLSLPADAQAETEFRFFAQPEMDFWNKSKSLKVEKNLQPVPSSSVSATSERTKDSSFPWNKYLDPKNDEFFREGEYLPPEPFMEIARDPSNENIEHWFKYLEAKNQITRRLQEKLAEYAAKSSVGLASHPYIDNTAIPTVTGVPQPVPLRADSRQFRLRLYFDSKCPHCAHMMETLKTLSQMGYWIELRQIDQDLTARNKIPFPVTQASALELKQYQIESVPLLLVGNLKAHTYFKIQGYQPAEAVLQTFSNVVKQTTNGGIL